jgi:hypothetical protein
MPFIASLEPNKIMAASTFSYQIIIPIRKLVNCMFQFVLEIVPTNCTNEKNAGKKSAMCFFIEIGFLFLVIGMGLKMCVRESSNLPLYTLMNDKNLVHHYG